MSSLKDPRQLNRQILIPSPVLAASLGPLGGWCPDVYDVKCFLWVNSFITVIYNYQII